MIRVHRISCLLAASVLLAASTATMGQDFDVAALRDAAMEDDLAYEMVEGLTTEIGPRMPGTEAEARARDWAVATFEELGFENVRIETFEMPVWVRGEETAQVVSPFPQPLRLTALGNSGATPEDGLTAEVVFFENFDALVDAEVGSLDGKIAFVTHDMTPTQDGSGYGQFGVARFQGPNVAAKKGAAAYVVKSIGTDHGRGPHAGNTSFEEDVEPIPAAALSTSDARNLQRMIERADEPVVLKLVLTPRNLGMQESGNVIAEVPGSDPDAGIVLIGGHLDSWDLGTGAIDDASGCAITAAAAKRIMDAGQPRRTIRVVWFGAEEVGVFGGRAYQEAHAEDPHVLAAESDFGADRVWRLETTLPEEAAALHDRLAAALAPLGIVASNAPASGGADVRPTIASGVAAVDLGQDGLRYFDLHHTPEDTLDAVDPEQLRQNVAAWTAMLAIVANAPEEIGPIEREE